MDVVVVLPGIVEERLVLAVGPLHDLLDALALQLRAFEEVVAGIDVGRVMLVVVELERFARHVGLKRIVGIGQVGQRERHRCLLSYGFFRPLVRPLRARRQRRPGPRRLLQITAFFALIGFDRFRFSLGLRSGGS
jgi:hypothetical protein